MTESRVVEMTMVERVKRALIELDGCAHDYHDQAARAAIAAMREPTEAMLLAAEFDGTSDLEKWQAMIDEAL